MQKNDEQPGPSAAAGMRCRAWEAAVLSSGRCCVVIIDPTPHLPRSVHPVTQWILAAERGESPTGLPLQRVRWFAETAEWVIAVAYAVDPYESGVVTAGEPPRFLGPDPAELGSARWLLRAPCVVAANWLDAERKLQLEVVVVASHRQLARIRKRTNQPKAGLMSELSRLVHRPKREQQRSGETPGGGDAGDR